jgi:DNA replication protein DnaC
VTNQRGKKESGETLEDRDYKNQETVCGMLCQGEGIENCLNHTKGWKLHLDKEATKNYGYNYYTYYKCPKRKVSEQSTHIERNVGSGYKHTSFESFTVDPSSKESFEKCKNYANGLTKHTKTGLLLCGPTGTGKTHLAVAILREAVKKGLHSTFVYTPELIAEAKQEIKTGVNRIAGKVANTYFLVLDDLGAEYSTEWVLETLRRLIDQRSRDGKPTVVTTNLRTDQLEMMDERIFSRLKGMCERVVLTGKDRRVEHRQLEQQAIEMFGGREVTN